MKITIDTKEDSHEEIQKVIRLLSHLIGEHHEEIHSNRNIFDDSPTLDLPTSEPAPNIQTNPPSSQGDVFGNLFGAGPTHTSEEPAPKDAEEIEPQNTEETPEVIPY